VTAICAASGSTCFEVSHELSNFEGLQSDNEVDIRSQILVEIRHDLQQIEIHIAAHDDEFLGRSSEGAVLTDGKGDVGEGAGGVDGHFAGVRENLFDHEVGGGLGNVGIVGIALDEGAGGDAVGVPRGGVVAEGFVGEVFGGEDAVPGEGSLEGCKLECH